MGSGGLPYHYNTDFRKLTPPGVAGLPGGGPPGGRLSDAPGPGTRGYRGPESGRETGTRQVRLGCSTPGHPGRWTSPRCQ